MTELNKSDKDDPFLVQYQPSDLNIASEFLSTWLPYLSRDLCHNCSKTLSDRIRSLSGFHNFFLPELTFLVLVYYLDTNFFFKINIPSLGLIIPEKLGFFF